MARMFNITPMPRMLLGVQNQKWTLSGAVAELIDNSFGQGRGRASIVKIIHDQTRKTLAVVDNGQGMEFIGRLFQLGNTIGHTVGDIGHYGSGGTQAIIWLAEWVSVATGRKDGKIMNDHIRWADIFDMEDFRDVAVSNDWCSGSFLQFSEWLHGTAITMKLLPTRKLNICNLTRDLSRLFAPGLRKNKKIIWCQQKDGRIIDEYALCDPFEIKALPDNTVHFDIVVEHGDKHLPVNGVVSYSDEISHNDSVVRIGLGYREIMRTRDCFKSNDESYAGIGVSGWLDLGDGWQPYLSTTKDGLDSQPLYDALMTHVFEKICTLLKMSEEKTIDFELENIAINLALALGKAMKMKVTVQSGPLPGSDSGTHGEDEDEGGIPGTEKKQPKSKLDLGEDREAPATSHIRLVKQSDDQMMGLLARAGEDPEGIYVDINRDHPFVTEALRQKPVNRAALNLMTVTEIATLLIDRPKIMTDVFKQSLIDEIERSEGGDKVRKLVRYLIDSVPEKHHAAA